MNKTKTRIRAESNQKYLSETKDSDLTEKIYHQLFQTKETTVPKNSGTVKSKMYKLVEFFQIKLT